MEIWINSSYVIFFFEIVHFYLAQRSIIILINNQFNEGEINKMSTSLEAARTLQLQMRRSVEAGQYSEADGLFKQLRVRLLEFDSLPPLSLDTPNSLEERILGMDLFRNIIHKFTNIIKIIYYLLLLYRIRGNRW